MYDLSHLTQSPEQNVIGPIQDDEALFLYALIKCMRLKNILELGSLAGYSAINFLKAIPNDGKLYTVDINYINNITENHKHIQKDCRFLTSKDIDSNVDLIFFDCHMYDEQIAAFNNLNENKIINNKTILALHDTNLHPRKFTSS